MMLTSLFNYWHIFLSCQTCFSVLLPATARKERALGRRFPFIIMHICSPQVLTFLWKIGNRQANSILQWHWRLTSACYTGRRGYTSVVPLDALTPMRCTEAGGALRTEGPYRARDRCWRVNFDLHMVKCKYRDTCAWKQILVIFRRVFWTWQRNFGLNKNGNTFTS
jgi:hypothetical protein